MKYGYERNHWLKVADSTQSTDAYHAFLLAETYVETEAEAYAWLDSYER